MKSKKSECLCCSGDCIVLACSGASDVGQISDMVARKLRDSGVFKMSCLALIGAGIEESIDNFKQNKVLVIDGCSVDCGKKILEKNGIENYCYLRLSDIGLVKGQSPSNNENVEKAYLAAMNFQ